MVSDSFKKLPIISEIFYEGGRSYVKVQLNSGHIRKVRWYSTKGEKMPEIKKTSAFELEPEKPKYDMKKVIGFGDKGYITILKGNTDTPRRWYEDNCKYSKIFGWYFTSEMEYDTLPYGIKPIKINWEDISENDVIYPDAKIKEVIDTKLYPPSKSEFAGEIGDKIEKNITVAYVKDVKSEYGTSYFHVLEDLAGNIYTWTTNVRKLGIGEKYYLTGSIKDLKKYKNQNQTVLTRCKVYSV